MMSLMMMRGEEAMAIARGNPRAIEPSRHASRLLDKHQEVVELCGKVWLRRNESLSWFWPLHGSHGRNKAVDHSTAAS